MCFSSLSNNLNTHNIAWGGGCVYFDHEVLYDVIGQGKGKNYCSKYVLDQP